MTKANNKIGIAEMHKDIQFIKERLTGNGEKGLFRKVDELTITVNKLKNYGHIKNWILGGAITVLSSIIGFLIGYKILGR